MSSTSLLGGGLLESPKFGSMSVTPPPPSPSPSIPSNVNNNNNVSQTPIQSPFSLPSSPYSLQSIFGIDPDRDTDAAIDRILLNESDSEAFKHKFEDLPRAQQYGYEKTTFICTSFFPKQFHALRMYACGGDIEFLQSLARCSKWIATGGKSGSTFSKTHDDRFVLKYVNRNEVKMFLDIANKYFHYMSKACYHALPSLIVKILGVYQVSWKKPKGEKMSSQYVFVMPNLFVDRIMTRVFDLKGSARNRYVKKKQREEGSRVLLDENLWEYTNGYPISLSEHSKHILRLAVFNDTLFLSSLQIVDYSILVGVDEKSHQLVVGIIDFIRQYTWDKKMETQVKSLGMIAGQSLPTVISPNNYKLRFRQAMDRYFIIAPHMDSKVAITAASSNNASHMMGGKYSQIGTRQYKLYLINQQKLQNIQMERERAASVSSSTGGGSRSHSHSVSLSHNNHSHHHHGHGGHGHHKDGEDYSSVNSSRANSVSSMGMGGYDTGNYHSLRVSVSSTTTTNPSSTASSPSSASSPTSSLSSSDPLESLNVHRHHGSVLRTLDDQPLGIGGLATGIEGGGGGGDGTGRRRSAAVGGGGGLTSPPNNSSSSSSQNPSNGVKKERSQKSFLSSLFGGSTEK